MDDRGRPIPDLTLAEFTVRIDGVPRRAVSAEWVPRISNTPARARVPASPENPGSIDAAGSGPLILIVIDQPNIRIGGTIGHRAAINHFIDRLQPSDRASVVNLGAGGKSVDFTTDRGRMKKVVSSLTGGVPYPPSNKTAGDMTLDFVDALRKDLRTSAGPKTLLLVSQGLSFSDEALSFVRCAQRAAAAARTTIYSLRLDERVSDITQKQPDTAFSPPPTTGGQGGGFSRELPDLPFPSGPAGDRGAKGHSRRRTLCGCQCDRWGDVHRGHDSGCRAGADRVRVGRLLSSRGRVGCGGQGCDVAFAQRRHQPPSRDRARGTVLAIGSGHDDQRKSPDRANCPNRCSSSAQECLQAFQQVSSLRRASCASKLPAHLHDAGGARTAGIHRPDIVRRNAADSRSSATRTAG